MPSSNANVDTDDNTSETIELTREELDERVQAEARRVAREENARRTRTLGGVAVGLVGLLLLGLALAVVTTPTLAAATVGSLVLVTAGVALTSTSEDGRE